MIPVEAQPRVLRTELAEDMRACWKEVESSAWRQWRTHTDKRFLRDAGATDGLHLFRFQKGRRVDQSFTFDGIPLDIYVYAQWKLAAPKVIDWIRQTHPSGIILVGTSAQTFFSEVFGITDGGEYAGIPTYFFTREESAAISFAWGDREPSVIPKHVKFFHRALLETKLGVLPRDIAYLDEHANSGSKAYTLWALAHMAGVERIYQPTLAAYHENALLSPVGSTDPRFVRWMTNFAHAVSFLSKPEAIAEFEVRPDEAAGLARLRELVDDVFEALRMAE